MRLFAMTVVLCLFQHEMIHALLFVAENNRDHDGHGPQFQAHMTRINAKTGANITVKRLILCPCY
jgi:hypothetical protein